MREGPPGLVWWVGWWMGGWGGGSGSENRGGGGGEGVCVWGGGDCTLGLEERASAGCLCHDRNGQDFLLWSKLCVMVKALCNGQNFL